MQGTQVPGVSEGLRVDIPGGPTGQGRGHGAQGFVAVPVAVPIAPHALHRHREVLSVNPGDSRHFLLTLTMITIRLLVFPVHCRLLLETSI